MYISKIKVGDTIYDIKAGENNVQANWNESDSNSDAYIQNKPSVVTTADINALFGIIDNNGSTPTLINSDTLDQAVGNAGYIKGSEISSWAKQSTKPSYTYSEIGYTATPVSASTSTLALAGTDTIYLVTVGANISSVTLTANPSAGHSCHVLFVSDSNDSNEYTVAIAHDSTNRVCPAGEDLSFTVPKNAGGYVEVDFLNVNNKVYVRGV